MGSAALAAEQAQKDHRTAEPCRGAMMQRIAPPVLPLVNGVAGTVATLGLKFPLPKAKLLPPKSRA